MKQKLTKSQVRLLTALAQQREEVKKVFTELLEAEREQVSLLAEHYGLNKDRRYDVSVEGEDVYLVEIDENKTKEN